MTYEGARARPADSEINRVFVVSKIRFDAHENATAVLWSEVNSRSNLDVGAEVVVPVADVVDAIHDGAEVLAVFGIPFAHLPPHRIVALEHPDGSETIALQKNPESAPAHLLALRDMPQLAE